MSVTAIDLLRAELEKFGSADEARNLAFINALCDSFRAKLLSYYRAGASAEARLQRVAEISAVFRDIKLKDGRREFTIAAKQIKIKAAPVNGQAPGAVSAPEQIDYRCPTGTQCIDGNCVPTVGGEIA
jgi:hypothetical protein